MKVAVLGKGKINSILEKQFELGGISPLLFEDVANVKSISGEKGNFIIKYEGNSIGAGYVIVTEEPCEARDSIAGCGVVPLEDNAVLDTLPYSNMPVVFVLDYPVESPAYTTRAALEKAIKLARRKRKVVYLSKFMRTAGDMLESLYREARNSGVIFFKYDTVSINYSDENELYNIVANDLTESISVATCTPVIAGKNVYSEDFLKTIKVLKFKLSSDGRVNEDSFFLYPSLTNRKGIYFINGKTSSGSDSELMSQVQYIMADIKEDFNKVQRQDTPDILSSEVYAEIDSEKCAFCYTCYRACPHFAMAPDYENSVMKNMRASCDGCGICSSICPANAVTMANKDNREEIAKGSLKVFCCENSAAIAYERIADSLKEKNLEVEVTPVGCGGELSAENIVTALKSFDKVLVAVCIDSACRHFEGNKRAKRYVDRAKEILKASGNDENRVVYMQLSHAMPMVLNGYINEMVQV